MEHTAKRTELIELQSILNDAVIYGDLLSPEILEISIKLDQLIVDFYRENPMEEDEVK